MKTLTLNERAELKQCEDVIRHGKDVAFQVGLALKAINDKRLYEEEFGTFAEYVAVKWGMSKSRAYQLMEFSGLVANLSTTVDIPEGAVRELQGFSQQTKVLALEQAAQNRKSEDQPITAEDVRQALEQTVCRHKGKLPPRDVEKIIERTEDRLADEAEERELAEELEKNRHTLLYCLDKARRAAAKLNDQPLEEEIAAILRRAKASYGR